MQQPNDKERQDLITRLQSALIQRVRVEQSKLYLRLNELVSGLDVDADGKVKNSTVNLQQQTKISRVFNTFQRETKSGLLRWLVNSALKLLGLNAAHFKGVNPLREDTINERAVKRLLLRLGVDGGKIVEGSWLDTLAGASPVKLNVLRRFSSAILGGADVKAFQKTLANDFVSKGGIVEKFYDQQAGNLFLSVDREVGNLYREELKLDHALYAGTEKDTTRPFCRARFGRIYTLDEINRWNSIDWSGKIPGADVKVAAGGYACRHTLSWITKETAERIADRRGIEINTYN